MSTFVAWLRRLGFWVGPVVLAGSLLLAGALVLGGVLFYPLLIPALLLLVVPAGGLWLGWWLIAGSAQPLLWALVMALAMTPLATPPDRLVFLIPAGFRGEVTLIQQVGDGQPLPRANGYITLRVPANGFVTTSDELESDWLTEATYYFTDAAGQRLGELPQLGAPDDDKHSPPPANRQQVGIFTASLAHKRIFSSADFARIYSGLPASYLNQEAGYLSFTVSCHDSLGVLQRRPPF
jgi:hypothetical protein